MSSSIAKMQSEYDAVVVGSGYGGAIAACRLARAGWSVCVLERGREIRPGEYPDTLSRAMADVQVDHPQRHVSSPTALFDFRLNRDINVLVGCGLGGTSLINANVALRPRPWVFEHPSWPLALRRDIPRLDHCFAAARNVLGPATYPVDGAPLLKRAALERMAGSLGSPFKPVPLNVTFTDPAERAGDDHGQCRLCGDCVTGCNYNAKRTVLTTYLKDAHLHRASIFTEASVDSVERIAGGRWAVRFDIPGARRDPREAPRLSVLARTVILAAGTLGSTEILLRSRARHHLAVSDTLGGGFSANGDVLAAAYNCDTPIDGVGAGVGHPNLHQPVGPCITGMIECDGAGSPEHEMVIQDGSMPGALSSVIPAVLGGAAALWGTPTARNGGGGVSGWFRHFGGARHGATRRTQILLVMTHDDAGGRMTLEDDRLRIDWPKVTEQPMFARVETRLTQVVGSLGGTYVPNPLRPVTVHPLGGCRMSDDPGHGVVDHQGRVFDGDGGVHYGLYVCDGSVIPRSLGVNPLLTIAALAERTCRLLLRPDPRFR